MMPLKHHCPACAKLLAWEDKVGVKPAKDAVLKQSPNQAPRVKCGNCNLIVILTKGSL